MTGVIHPDHVIRNIGVQPGDALVLTKPLGTGIVTTGLKRRKASPASVRAAVRSMVRLNDTASAVMRAFPVHACSDVTGFGLLGHAFEMASGSGVTIVLEAKALPLLPGARKLAQQGCLTGGCRRNRDYLQNKTSIDPKIPADLVEIALDPQTSGGLLIALPAEPRRASVTQRRHTRSACDSSGTSRYGRQPRRARPHVVHTSLFSVLGSCSRSVRASSF